GIGHPAQELKEGVFHEGLLVFDAPFSFTLYFFPVVVVRRGWPSGRELRFDEVGRFGDQTEGGSVRLAGGNVRLEQARNEEEVGIIERQVLFSRRNSLVVVVQFQICDGQFFVDGGDIA